MFYSAEHAEHPLQLHEHPPPLQLLDATDVTTFVGLEGCMNVWATLLIAEFLLLAQKLVLILPFMAFLLSKLLYSNDNSLNT